MGKRCLRRAIRRRSIFQFNLDIRERSLFEVRIDGRSLLKFKLQLLCGINFCLQLGKDFYK
ncbi:hypothetical protein [Nostoc sp. 'Lobaria pulmonaria (5183) cyanobiont']|uniref:hypothetical protein n=1 Tax=Nostoc sp. 'Lobaria pulmonaria (5183) cyanobiont' TaxID=1618022 RepID=UPI001319D3E3|nr:hypothetical protein [Nostoc sp. 'Lobaria pulmonaria (5183) cyanobiont']